MGTRDAPIHIFPLPIPVHEFGYLEVPIRALFALILALLLISFEAALNKHEYERMSQILGWVRKTGKLLPALSASLLAANGLKTHLR